jgi:hypothetical protein
MNDHVKRWQRGLDEARDKANTLDEIAFFAANKDATARAIDGFGVDDTVKSGSAGAHVVFNVSSAYIPAICSSKDRSYAYKNSYDLGAHRVGDKSRRDKIDSALPTASLKEHVYFGAVEINGCGIRFYGDICLVLCGNFVPPETIILDRNSYDVERPPLNAAIEKALTAGDKDTARREAAEQLSAIWKDDLSEVAFAKICDRLGVRTRRLTTGDISDGVLLDEDYIEVLLVREEVRDGMKRYLSFDISEVLQARTAPSEAVLEERIDGVSADGGGPSLEQLAWLRQRRDAARALRDAGIPLRVVTFSGRSRG